jgi:hypothetical protein
MLDWGLNGGSLLDGFWDALTAPIQDWLGQYPVLLWLGIHPLWLVVVILLVLFLLSGLLRAVAGLTEKLWLVLLRLPILLVRWVWRGTLFLLSRPFAAKPVAQSSLAQSSLVKSSLVNPPLLDSADRLTEVLDRLEALRQEQDELLKEVKSLLVKEKR